MPASGEYSVCQFFMNDYYEYVTRFVDAEEAVLTAKRLSESVGARVGTTKCIIITYGDNYTCFEWKFGEGVTFT
jgi:hypothetical protein